MEHNQEKIIREKILLSEGSPAVWDRSLVKAGIGLLPARTGYKVYYMAASVLLAISLAFIFWQWSNLLELQLRLSEVQLEIEKQAASSTQLVEPLLADANCPPDQKLPIPNVASSPTQPLIVTIVQVDTIRLPERIIQIDPIAEIPKKDAIVLPVDETNQPQAIVGRPVTADAKTKDKKFRLLLFRGDEPEAVKEPTDEPIAINKINN